MELSKRVRCNMLLNCTCYIMTTIKHQIITIILYFLFLSGDLGIGTQNIRMPNSIQVSTVFLDSTISSISKLHSCFIFYSNVMNISLFIFFLFLFLILPPVVYIFQFKIFPFLLGGVIYFKFLMITF